jgi:hypothetical protein
MKDPFWDFLSKCSLFLCCWKRKNNHKTLSQGRLYQLLNREKKGSPCIKLFEGISTMPVPARNLVFSQFPQFCAPFVFILFFFGIYHSFYLQNNCNKSHISEYKLSSYTWSTSIFSLCWNKNFIIFFTWKWRGPGLILGSITGEKKREVFYPGRL